ncbi:MAG TPA: PKD domain-containing protein [Flavobacteriales bacterium]|nr:PKD domain-containing protein [Flavobacteriales bacterium]
MKSGILLTAAMCLCIIGGVFAQSNLDFETWGVAGAGNNDPIGWGTFNTDAFAGPVSTYQETSQPGEGLSSARLVTTSGYAALLGIDTVGGMVSLGGDLLGDLVGGIAYTQTPTSVDLVYKSSIMPGDTGFFLIQLSHWDGTLSVLDAFAISTFAGAAVTTWTPLNLPFTYITTDTPDTMIMVGISSQELFFAAPAAIPGSTLELDAIVLNTGGTPCNTPIASFTSSSTSLVATFTDGSTTTGTTNYFWDFGDSFGTSLLQNPTYTYSAAGTYNVCLAVVDSCGTDQLCQTITVTSGGGCPTPTASFGADTSGGLSVVFTDASTTTGTTTYLWNFGDSFGTSLLQNPSYTYSVAGTYNVCLTVVDSCGTNQYCQNVTVTSGGGCNLAVTATSTDESSAGMNDGTATAFASNGTAPYNYLWSDGQTTAIATGLAPGTYAVTVIDADSCVATATVTIAAGSVICQIQISITTTDETSPGGNDGSAVAVVTNGTQPYIYLWSTGATTSAISGLAPGVYTCSVVDADICTTGGTGVVQAFQCTLTGTMASTDETSLGAMDGTATVTVSGGTAPYAYAWSNFATTSSISGLAPGLYDVAVSDANGCTYNASAAVNPGGLGCNLSASVTGTGESQAGANDGSASVTVSGGTAPISVTWDTGDTTSTISSLAPGDYTVVLLDAMGCIATATYTVSAGLIIGVPTQVVQVVSVNVYPNPAAGFINFEIDGADRAMLYVFDFAGRQVKEIAINQMLTQINTADLNNGMYFYQLIGMNSDHLGSGKFVISK